MESERRERYERIKDSKVAAENTGACNSVPAAGGSEYSGQVVRILYQIADSGSGWILDSSLYTGKPGKCDPAFYISSGVHRDPGPASDHKPSHSEA